MMRINNVLLLLVLSFCFFIVGFPNEAFAITDVTGPEITSLSIDKTEVQPGDTITVTMTATDESGISTVSRKNYAWFELKDTNRNTHYQYVYFDVQADGTYQGSLTIQEDFYDGTYECCRVDVYDTVGNYTLTGSYPDVYFTVDTVSYFKQFEGIDDYENATVVSSNKTISDDNIVGDLYIAPNAIATVKNTTITGTIYVLGTLRATSITANSIHAKSMTFGGYAYGNGAASLKGSNSVGSIIAYNKVIDEVPLRIDSDLISVDGKFSIKGAYVNIATMFVNDNQVKATSTGKFYLNDINVGDATSINIKFVTAEGETFTKDYDIVVGTLDNDGKPNGIPIITASDISICEGADLDLLDGVNANDHEDGDISSLVKSSPSTLSNSEPGEYDVQYSVTDSQGTEATKTITVEIKSHEWDGGTIVADATCTKDGKKKYVCANCNKEKKEVIPATGHKWNNEYTVDKEASCTEEGSKSIHCSVCNSIDESTVTVIPKADHTYGEWKITKEATCTEDGSKEKVCEVCGDKVTEVIPATGHSFSEEYITDTPASCTTEGSKSKHCAYCDETKNQEVVSALGHDWNSEPTVEKVTTCTEDGAEAIHCTRCDAVKDGSEKAIPKTGHKFGAWKTTKAATEIAMGQKTRTCSVCGHVEKQTIAMLKPTLPAVKITTPKAAKKAAAIKWKKVSKANQKKIAKIEVQYSMDKNFKTGVKTVYAKKSAVSKKISKLKSKKTYYIRIRAYKKSGGVVHVSKWSSVKKFKAK